MTQGIPLTVVSSERLKPTSNPYLIWLKESLDPDIVMRWMSWRTLLLGRYDILHVHWPEYLFDSPHGMRRVAKVILGYLLLVRLCISRRPVVRTVHTAEPYEPTTRTAQHLTRLLERRTVASIFLNESWENRVTSGCVILLGRYSRQVCKVREEAQHSHAKRMLFFGQLRPHKGLEDLIHAFRDLDDADLSLQIIGRPFPSRFGDQLTSLAETDPRIRLTGNFVPDDELSSALQGADVVVLPYRAMYNSSALILALEHRVPVVATRSPSVQALADEVGSSWVTLVDPPITASSLRVAMRSVRESAVDRIESAPDLSRREWAVVGDLHSRLFRFVSETARCSPRGDWQAQVRRRVEEEPAFRSHSQLNAGRGA